jgi:hypothetical protein
MTKFKIENFCEEHNKEFKIYYKYLNNPYNIHIIFYYLNKINDERIQKFILNLIKKNKKYVLEQIERINIIVSFYEQNDLINKSDIGKFFTYYKKNIKDINIKKDDDLLKLFNKMIEYDNLIIVLKECFYIFSEYRSCIYFLTPSINFNIYGEQKKSVLKKVIHNFKNNFNTLTQVISKIYLGDNNPWSSVCYSSAYAIFDTLNIIKKYYKNPLAECDIIFKVSKKIDKKNIIKNLCIEYNKTKLKNSYINLINENNIKNVSHFIIILKKLGYDLWYVIPLIFNTFFIKYKLYKKGMDGIPESPIFGHKNIYYQKNNYLLGIQIFILLQENLITNSNILQNFND